MKILPMTLNHDDFFCPFTGRRILGPEIYNRSPALIGIWFYDNILEPELHDIELMAEWETFRKDRGHFQLEEFWAYVQNESWAAIILTNKGEGCTETVTIAYVFNIEN